ncbi:MAG: RlmE family RNA methyltransferase [Betaproteobacteria bacterium]|jgi:23S rRNA (uridine2552-2'-O)-methyltransferase
MEEHVSDQFVKRAEKDGWRSRAAYKLIEIQEEEKFLKPGMVVVDLGAAPGSWSQVVSEIVGDTGKVFALDLLEISPMPRVEIIRGDFTAEEVLIELEKMLNGSQVDLVISDMAPNISGIKAVDQAKWLGLAELAFDFCHENLKRNGSLLVKCFEGSGTQGFRESLRQAFNSVKVKKPAASRDRSSEFFLFAKGKKG